MKATISQVVIAVDPHKHVNAINVLTEAGEVVARESFAHDRDGLRELMTFARRWPARRWAVEGCGGVGKNLAQQLVARGEQVLDVPSRKSSLIRAFASNSGRKTDDIDAYSVGLAALRTPDLEQVTADGSAIVLRLLAHRRRELVASRSQALCRLHRDLQVMVAGGAPKRVSVTKAKKILASVRPGDEVGTVRKQLALDQLHDVVTIDKRLAAVTLQINEAVKATVTTLQDIVGVGPIVTAIVIGEVRNIARFKDRHHFASYTGAAPTTWGSAGDAQPAVNLGGNRQLNYALHIAALAQMRVPGPGRDYYQRKLAAGKTKKAAMRCLKRRISDAIYRALVADAARSPGGQTGATCKTSATGSTPTAGSSVRPLPGLAANPTLHTTKAG